MVNDKLHKDALVLFEKLTHNRGVGAARATIANYNERRKKTTEALRPILIELDADFNAGKVHGGCGSMKEYCKRYRNYGCLTYRRVRQVITGTSGNSKVKSLHPGDLINVNGMKLKIRAVPDADGGFQKVKGGSYRLTFLAEPVTEEPAASPVNPWAPFRSKAAWTRNQHEADQVAEYMKKSAAKTKEQSAPTLTVVVNERIETQTDAQLKKRRTALNKEWKECKHISDDHTDRLECTRDRMPGYTAPTDDVVEAHYNRVNKLMADRTALDAEMLKRGLLVPRKAKGAEAKGAAAE